MKKRLLVAVLLLMMAALLSACGKGKDSEYEVFDDDVDWSTNSEFNTDYYMAEVDLSRSSQWDDAPRLSIQFYDIVVSSGMRLSTLLDRVAKSKVPFNYDINPDRLINDYDTYTFYDGFNMEVFTVKVGKFGDAGVEPAKDCIVMEIWPEDYSCCRFFEGDLSYEDIMNYSYSDVPKLLEKIKGRDSYLNVTDDGLNYSIHKSYWGNNSINTPECAYIYGKEPSNAAKINFSIDPDTAKMSEFTYVAVITQDRRDPIYRYDQHMQISEEHVDEPWMDIGEFSDQVKLLYDKAYAQNEEYGSVAALYIGIASDFTEISTNYNWLENDVTFFYLVFADKRGYFADGYSQLMHCNAYNVLQENYRDRHSILGNDGRYYADSEEELIEHMFANNNASNNPTFIFASRDSSDTLHGLKRIVRISPDKLRELVDFSFK